MEKDNQEDEKMFENNQNLNQTGPSILQDGGLVL